MAQQCAVQGIVVNAQVQGRSALKRTATHSAMAFRLAGTTLPQTFRCRNSKSKRNASGAAAITVNLLCLQGCDAETVL